MRIGMLPGIALALLAISLPAAGQSPLPVPGPEVPCTRNIRFGLSNLANEVLTRIETNQAALADSPISLGYIPTYCNRLLSAPVDGPAIFAAARNLIAEAQHEVDIVFYQWDDNSQAASEIGLGLLSAQQWRTPADPLFVRIVISDFEWLPSRPINELWNSQKTWVAWGLDLNRVQLQFATSPGATAVLHDKLIIVDGKKVLITGAMPQTHHDSPNPWHDSAYVFEGMIASSSLANFEDSWVGNSFHWTCSQASFQFDCQKRANHYAQPQRPWMPAHGSHQPGGIPILGVGRTRGQFYDNDTDNPQDIAWLTLMERATSHIYVETPNINDDAFQDAVVSAVARGVRVQLITSLGFNDQTEDIPTQGGDNQQIVGSLRAAIRSRCPWYEDRFQLRWYSPNGIEPIGGNGPGASHTKFMAVDDRVAIVGSGNMDTASWNASHEFNFLVDDPTVTAYLQNNLFLPDWSRASTSYVELYGETYIGTNLVCPVAVVQDKQFKFSDPIIFLDGDSFRCNNDKAKSIFLHEVPAGRWLRFYDDPQGDHEDDDWTEIIVKRFVSRKFIPTLEAFFEDDDVAVRYHRDNGLNGKVSFTRITNGPATPVVDLYEGNGGTQSLVCSTLVSGPRSIDLTSDSHCDNDAARSMALYQFPATWGILVYDSPGGSTSDDWTVIVPKRTVSAAVIPTFEATYETADFRVCHRHDNGLDGKVSRMRFVPIAEAVALCGPFTQPLSLTLAGTGYGTVLSSPSGIACGATCSASFPTGTVVTLQASANSGSTFAGWSGGGCSGTGLCNVALSTAQQVTATFTLNPPATYLLSVQRLGAGSGTVTSSPAGINCGPTCTASLWAGTWVTLTATPAHGSTFAGWSGGGCSGTAPTCQVPLDSNRSTQATFSPSGPPPAGCGEGSCVAAQGMYISHFSGLGCTGTESYYLPYDGYAYACRTWDGSGQCGTVRRTVTNTSVRINGGGCQDLWTSGNTLSDFVTVYRGGTPPPPPPPPATYTLTVAKSGTGSGTVAANVGSLYCGYACSASYTQGSQVLLSATAAPGSVFAGWSGGGCYGTSSSCAVAVSSNSTTQATFNAVSGGGCGEGSCVSAQGAYVSHFTGPNCTGTESYYTPYDGYAYACRSWDGGGNCGTIRRTVTNVSYRLNGNPCVDQAWPQGNTLSEFVTVYR